MFVFIVVGVSFVSVSNSRVQLLLSQWNEFFLSATQHRGIDINSPFGLLFIHLHQRVCFARSCLRVSSRLVFISWQDVCVCLHTAEASLSLVIKSRNKNTSVADAKDNRSEKRKQKKAQRKQMNIWALVGRFALFGQSPSPAAHAKRNSRRKNMCQSTREVSRAIQKNKYIFF